MNKKLYGIWGIAITIIVALCVMASLSIFEDLLINTETVNLPQYEKVTRITENLTQNPFSNKFDTIRTFNDELRYKEHKPVEVKSVKISGVAYVLTGMLIILLAILFSFYLNSLKKIDENEKKENDRELHNTKSRNYLRRTIFDLQRSILKYQSLGALGLIVTLITLLVLGLFVTRLFQNTINDVLQFSHNESYLAVLLVVLRTSLLGSFIISFVVYSFRFTNSCFDQAVRFNKRKHASLFLMEVLKDFKVFNAENEKGIMNAFREWNVSVESAFTDNKHNPKETRQYIDLLRDFLKLDKGASNPPKEKQ